METLTRSRFLTLLSALPLTTMTAPFAAPDPPARLSVEIDWPRFMACHDLVWERLPENWWEAPFLGNGMLGTMIRQTGAQSVRWDVGRSDVQDHRPLSEGGTLFAQPRLPIGYFELTTASKITGGSIRLDLWNAEATGMIATDAGKIHWRSFVHADQMIIKTEVVREGGESAAMLEWHALAAESPRFHSNSAGVPTHWEPNPSPVIKTVEGINVCYQPLLRGGDTSTAWAIRKSDQTDTLLVSVAHSLPGTPSSQTEAVQAVQTAATMSPDTFEQSHRKWWHDFYPASFFSIPDTRWESFYWIQMYKLASATRADRALIDNQGPWLQPTPWPDAWWNLNVQLSYWPTVASNHCDLMESLTVRLDRYSETLTRNVPEPYRGDSAGIARSTGQQLASDPLKTPRHPGAEIGNLTWALHDYYLQYRATMDDRRLRDHLFPLLRRSINYYLHFLTPDATGVLHLPMTYSPEYGDGTDCNYDLALLRWGLETLVAANSRLKLNDPLLSKWQETLAHLTPFPTDANGYRIAADVPFDHGHRHFSHLLMAYPLYLVNADQPGAKALIDKSVAHWHSMGAKQGYSFTGGASLMASFGEGNQALELLNGLNHFLQASTMYKESGPVIETPLSAAKSIQDMLLQSWGDTIRVFPAMPDAWSDAIFHDFRAQGAFLVSARRLDGATQWVRIRSLAGEPCKIKPEIHGDLKVISARKLTLNQVTSGFYTLDLRKDEEAILYSSDNPPDLTVKPVTADVTKTNSWGLKAAAVPIK